MEPTTITLQDLSIVISIIDVCSERGAFKGNELAIVGQVREKISAFVKQNQKIEEAQPSDDVEGESDENAE